MFRINCVVKCKMLFFQGSYGRLGLGNSDSQPTMKDINTFPNDVMIRKVANSKGSDGHSLAIDMNGRVYSWGDGNNNNNIRY